LPGEGILWKGQSADPEKIADQEKIEGSRPVIVIRDRNEEAATIGDPKKKGENDKKESDKQNNCKRQRDVCVPIL